MFQVLISYYRCLFKGKYDLGCIAKSSAKGPRSKTRKYLARQREEINNRSELQQEEAIQPVVGEVAIQV